MRTNQEQLGHYLNQAGAFPPVGFLRKINDRRNVIKFFARAMNFCNSNLITPELPREINMPSYTEANHLG